MNVTKVCKFVCCEDGGQRHFIVTQVGDPKTVFGSLHQSFGEGWHFLPNPHYLITEDVISDIHDFLKEYQNLHD